VATEFEIKKFQLQQQNYSVASQANSYNGQPEDSGFNVNGSNSYSIDDEDVAFKFAEMLIAKKMQVGLNSNGYHNGECAEAVER